MSAYLSAGEGAGVHSTLRSEYPDLVIMDTSLPDMDGLDVLRGIRAFSQVLVIVLGVVGGERERAAALAAGADAYLPKPFARSPILS